MAIKWMCMLAIGCLIWKQACSSGSVTVVRGIHPSLAPMYQTDGKNPFQCLDGSKSIPYDQVNDDYCDCQVSSTNSKHGANFSH